MASDPLTECALAAMSATMVLFACNRMQRGFVPQDGPLCRKAGLGGQLLKQVVGPQNLCVASLIHMRGCCPPSMALHKTDRGPRSLVPCKLCRCSSHCCQPWMQPPKERFACHWCNTGRQAGSCAKKEGVLCCALGVECCLLLQCGRYTRHRRRLWHLICTMPRQSRLTDRLVQITGECLIQPNSCKPTAVCHQGSVG